jgi:hypothetical protein
MERGEKPTVQQRPARPDVRAGSSPEDALGPLDEVLTATVPELYKLARLYAWFEARQAGRRTPLVADEEKFMMWALRVRSDRREIEPHKSEDRDVS